MSIKDNLSFDIKLGYVIEKWHEYYKNTCDERYQSTFTDNLLSEAEKAHLDLINFIDNYVEENCANYSLYLEFINKKGLLSQFMEYCNDIGLARRELEKNK